MRKVIFLAVSVLLATLSSQSALAVVIDLTASPGPNSGTINGAIYTTGEVQPAGTGVIYSFVRLEGNDGNVEGHNTSGRALLNDENNSGVFTRDLLTDDVPLVEIAGMLYREFLFDINENVPGGLLNLNDVRISQSDTAGLLSGDGTGLGTLIYAMDSSADDNNTVVLDYNLIGTGSGASDMFLYVLDSAFLDLDYVYLWSVAGLTPPDGGTEDAGFEEWAVRLGDRVPVPEPTTLGLLGIGLLGLGLTRRRRKSD